jgi:hypothetical protein
MRSIFDSSFDYTPSVEADMRKTFERVWRQLDDREQQEDMDPEPMSLWLECNGDLVDFGSVKMLSVRRSTLGIEMVQFVCPQCKQRHESLQFG